MELEKSIKDLTDEVNSLRNLLAATNTDLLQFVKLVIDKIEDLYQRVCIIEGDKNITMH